jgi:phosphonoacetate hydrolase
VDEPSGSDLARAVGVLCSEELEPLVELVAWSPEPGVYEAKAVDGHVSFRRHAKDGRYRYTSTTISGRDLLAEQDPAKFAPLGAELAQLQPSRRDNSYPYAYEHLSQLFDHRCAPDLCVLHTSAHRWETHRGEHGSLDVVQARAPFIVSGAGIRRDGLVERHCRLVDVAPTILALLGAPTITGIGPVGLPAVGRHLSRQDGEVVDGLLDVGRRPPSRVVGLLLDGANANVLYDAALKGEAPTVRRMIEEGTAFAHGAFASLPTVTMPNHTAILTGCHPGHHGVLHNAWYDRALGRQVITESPATWQEAMDWLAPGVETIHQALKRTCPGAVSVSVNEPADAGADYSTFELFRRGDAGRLTPERSEGVPPHATAEYFGSSRPYRHGTRADVMSIGQATAIWAGHHLGVDYDPPKFMWVSTSLTDAAFHEGGPHSDVARASIRDTDARIGEVVAAVEKAGVAEETAYVLVADHGMEHTAEDVTGDWGEALAGAGVSCRDEASGFLYLGI